MQPICEFYLKRCIWMIECTDVWDTCLLTLTLPSTPLYLPAGNVNKYPSRSFGYRCHSVAVGIGVQCTSYFVTQQFIALMTHIPLCSHIQYCLIVSLTYFNLSLLWRKDNLPTSTSIQVVSKTNILWSVSTQIQLLQRMTPRLISDTSAFVINHRWARLTFNERERVAHCAVSLKACLNRNALCLQRHKPGTNHL